MNISAVWNAFKSAVLKVFVFWVLLFAVYLALGRQLFPYIERYEATIEQWLSSQFQETVELGSVRGQWDRFGPVVTLSDVRIGASLNIKEMVLAPGVFESLSHGGLSFLRFELNEFNGHLVQSEQGWQLKGIRNSQQTDREAFDFDKLLELLQRQQNIQFISSSLKISPLDLPSFELALNKGELSGYKGENALVADAQVQFSDLSIPVELQAEFHQLNPNLNKIYVKHGAIDFSPWLNTSASLVSEARASGEYWLNFNGTQWRSLTARSAIGALTIEGRANPLSLTNVKATTVIEDSADGVLMHSIVDTFTVNGEASDGTELTVEITADENRVAWSRLPATLVGGWLAMNDRSEFWNNLNLQGNIHNGSALYSKGESASFKLATTFSDARMNAYQGVPGLDNLSGQVLVKNLQGQVNLFPSESRFQFPVMNQDTLLADIERSTVNWQIVPNIGLLLDGTHLSSLKHQNKPPLPLTISWFTSLKNEATKKEGYESSMGLMVSAPNVLADWITYIANSQLVPANAGQYITKNFISGFANDVEFSYLSRGEKESRSTQLDLKATINQASLTFLEGWSPVSFDHSQLILNEKQLEFTMGSGRYENFNLSRGELSLQFPTGDLHTDFSLENDAEEYLDLFKTGPLQSIASDVVNDWQATGRVVSDVVIDVNLNDPNSLEVTTLSDVISAQLTLKDLSLAFSDINGLLQFQSGVGFQANNIQLTHAGIEQSVTLSRDLADQQQLVLIDIKGETPLAFWGEYFNDPYLMGFKELVAHQSQVSIYKDSVAIHVSSDFKGPAFNFPKPMNKVSQQAWPSVIDIIINSDNKKTVWFEVEELAQGLIELSPINEILSASVSIGQSLIKHSEPGVFVDIQTEFLDGHAWWQTIQNMRSIYELKSPSAPESPSFESKLKDIVIDVDQVLYLGREWQDATIQLLRNNDAWLVEFEANEGAGNVLVPHLDEPMFADIEWLTVTTEDQEIPWQEQQDPLSEYLPTDVPAMEVQIKKLVWNDQDMGDWRANLTPINDALEVTAIEGNMPGATLTGQLVWRHTDNDHLTEFNGTIATADVLTVLNEWQYAPVLTSRDGFFEASLNWLGSPAFFDFKRVQGKVNLALTKGAILKVEEYEGIKLIGLLNFTRVLQRIALDFSDLLSSGITFDIIEGELLFDRGFARVGESLVIDGASTNFRFSGDADLLADVIDIDMVLTVPLSSTFPLVALLAGVSPQAAAAIYVTERVFNNELKKISSARMHITGSFEEPIIKFYRVFDSQLGSEEQTVTERIKSVVPSTASP